MLGGGLNSLIPNQNPKDNQSQSHNDSGQNLHSYQVYKEEIKNMDESVILHEKTDFDVKATHDFYQSAKHENPPASANNAPLNIPLKEESVDDFGYQEKQTYHKRPMMSQAVFLIEVEKIKPNPFQPRKHFDEDALKDLANSIREHGILQPLVVSKIENETESGTSVEYQLIAGERRLKASKLIGLERVPVIIRQAGAKSENLEIAIIENLQRENLDSIETARAYARLQDEFGMTQREIGTRLGKSREVVANALRLLSLPTELQNALSRGQINESQARLLLSIENPIAQNQLFNDIISNNLTVREVRSKVRKIHLGGQVEGVSASHYPAAQEVEMRNLEDKLKEVLGAEVKIEKKGEAGKIVITFYSPEEIYGLIHKINPHEREF